MSAAEDLARARALVYAGLALPPELGEVLLQIAANALPAAALRIERDTHLRTAGLLVGGSAWAQAHAIDAEAKALHRVWQHLVRQPPPLGTLRGHTFAALTLDPRRRLPKTRQLLNILQSPPD